MESSSQDSGSEWGVRVRTSIAQQLDTYWRQRHTAYQQGTDQPEQISFGDAGGAIAPATQPLPTPVQAAYDYYAKTVMERDWGSVTLHRTTVDERRLLIVRVQTDGDDGWIEVFDQAGTCLGVGRTYLELVAWGDPETLRAQVETGELPPQLTPDQSLWSQSDG
ncbi:MAG: hypothetical protein KME20_17950 [Kaiparowitsia implicata GSE-PSE-MK54-09C]|jgi:hypothetical protein|nr:hypothetical protein [Kaiparowitsia implicata GSE-PSE-MK54-09C]